MKRMRSSISGKSSFRIGFVRLVVLTDFNATRSLLGVRESNSGRETVEAPLLTGVALAKPVADAMCCESVRPSFVDTFKGKRTARLISFSRAP